MSAAGDSETEQQQPALRVQDALGYLDQVKSKFNDQPFVYNQFLDIMKEFKSQSLDTPGVIAKVSTLFRGHTDLIVGFNTFLPPGYRIEQMPHNNEIRITTLQGQTPATFTLAQHQQQHQQQIQQQQLQMQQQQQLQHQQQLQQQQPQPQSQPQQLQQTTNLTGQSVDPTTTQTHEQANSTNTITTVPTTTPLTLGETRITALIATTATNQQDLSSTPTNLTVASQQAQPKSNVGVSIENLYHPNTYTTVQAVRPPIVQAANYNMAKQVQTQQSATVVNSNTPNIHNSGQLNAVTIQGNMIVGPPQPTVVNQNEAPKQHAQQPPANIQPGSEFGFNHALTYVNKIKHRFSANPEIYQQFLEILHSYQRDQHATKVPRSKMLLESEVYNQVARLFQNQRDLLEEFSQFLPDANGTASAGSNINSLTRVHHQLSPSANVNSNPPTLGLRHMNDGSMVMNDDMAPVKRQNSRGGNHQNKISLKRQNNSVGNLTYNSSKRPRMTSLRDVSLAEAGKHGSLNEYAFFDKVRKALKSTEVYDNFLRCLVLYNHEIVSRTELVVLANNFIGRFPDLMKWFKEFLGFRDGLASLSQTLSIDGIDNLSTQPAQNRQRERDRIASEAGMEIDYSSCKRHGASYRGLPKSFIQPKCTGRTPLCKEVLNDTLVSFPSWSEDSTFVSSRKTQYEEYIYRCEDERFELDIVIESNLLTIRVLETVRRRIDKMSFEERNRFKLDDTLGGTSCVIHQRAIRRIYGDKAPEIIEGLKKNPVIAVPLVLRRLKAKDEEWREAQKQFNKIWREQNEKYYLKSLDHQGISFKQNDIKYLRSKSLIKEIEDLQRENQDDDLNASSTGGGDMVSTTELSNNAGLPHITLVYKDKDMLDEACNLIIHHVKRQTSIHKDEKQKIKQLMRQFVPDLFFAPRGELSDDEMDENDDRMDDDASSERRYDSSSDNNRKSFDNRNHGKNDLPSSPKPTSRYNRESPKLSCDESPLKDPELGEPIRPEQWKYLSDIENPTKDEAIPISLEERDHQKMEPLSVITENSNIKEGEDPSTHLDIQQREASFIKSPQQALQNKDPEDSYQMFYIDDKWYCFLRLHHILCQRLGSIYERSKVLIAEEEKERKDRKESTAIALRLKPRNDIEIEDYFPVFVDMIKQLLDGNLESNQYEDMLRDMFGIYAYVAFTMDKVVQNIVRQLQHMVGDEVSQQCTDLFLDETKNNSTGGPCATAQTRATSEANYLKKAEQLLEDENCYKATLYKNESKLTIGLLDTDSPDGSDNEDPEEKWSNFMNNEFSKDSKSRSGKKWFLSRNVRRYMAREEKLVNLSAANNPRKELAVNDDKNDVGEKPCAFSPDSYRRLLVFNNGDHVFFYRHHRPTKLRQTRVTDIKRKKFQEWTDRWASSNLSPEQIRRGIEWLGKSGSKSTNLKS